MRKLNVGSILKTFLLIGVFALITSSRVWASPLACTTSSLSVYDTLGFSCVNGGDVFSNFTYSSISSGGAIAIPDSGVNVIPVDTTSLGPGFTFEAAWSAGQNQTTDSLINFSINTGGPANISDASVIQTSSGIFDTGTVAVTEGLCLGGSSCQGGRTSILTVNSKGSVVLANQDIFSPTGQISASKDIALGGGAAKDGFASASAITDQFSTVPEPASLSLFGIGLLGFAFLFRRQLKATV